MSGGIRDGAAGNVSPIVAMVMQSLTSFPLSRQKLTTTDDDQVVERQRILRSSTLLRRSGRTPIATKLPVTPSAASVAVWVLGAYKTLVVGEAGPGSARSASR